MINDCWQSCRLVHTLSLYSSDIICMHGDLYFGLFGPNEVTELLFVLRFGAIIEFQNLKVYTMGFWRSDCFFPYLVVSSFCYHR